LNVLSYHNPVVFQIKDNIPVPANIETLANATRHSSRPDVVQQSLILQYFCFGTLALGEFRKYVSVQTDVSVGQIQIHESKSPDNTRVLSIEKQNNFLSKMQEWLST
jgi:hypothetical protein